MEQLNINHLEGYSKGKEGVKVKLNDDGLREIWEVEGDNQYVQGLFYIKLIDYDNKTVQLQSCETERWSIDEVELDWIELLLLPLSYLTKDIEVNGEKFVPCEWFNNINSHIEFELQIRALSNDIRWLNCINYGIIEQLFEWHFDVFGLIEKGLAIDVTTLKDNPYK